MKFSRVLQLSLASLLALMPFGSGCGTETGTETDAITDVPQSGVERQSIGNCWLYAEASWVESMYLSATSTEFDVSQSYWTYWNWYDTIIYDTPDVLKTGGSFGVAKDIIRERGLMADAKFIPEEATSEMSSRQSSALSTINRELKTGRLKDVTSRSNPALVRQVLDEAWQLNPTVKGYLTKAFGKDGQRTFKDTATTKGTPIRKATSFQARYTTRSGSTSTVKDTTLDVALNDWQEAYYPGTSSDSAKRSFQIRVQKALHDAQPVVITWDVDFNAMESYDPVLRGSFNMTTLKKAGGAGHQGGHMTVLEDYEATTQQYGELKAGVTLDPNNPEDKAKLDAALLPSTVIKFWRIKNSWGALRDDRSSAPGMPGYHDLYMDYMNGPITWCPDVEGVKNAQTCKGTSRPFRAVVLPPGY
jgi:hypothetical protein